MKKLLTATIAALTAAGAIAASAGAAQAEPYRYYGDRRHNNNNDAAAAAIVGGVIGLALGAPSAPVPQPGHSFPPRRIFPGSARARR